MHTVTTAAAKTTWFLSKVFLVGIPFLIMVIAAFIGCIITIKDIETVGPYVEKHTPFGWAVDRMENFTDRYFRYPT